MKKLVVSIVLIITLYFAARPFVLVTVDNGIAGISTRTSVQHKYETLAVWRWDTRAGGHFVWRAVDDPRSK
jgi:hypothetical protein